MEAKTAQVGEAHFTLLNRTLVLWRRYAHLKKDYRIVEKKYYGFLGVNHGRKRKEKIEEADLTKINDVRKGLDSIGSYHLSHNDVYLNGRIYNLQFKIQDFLKNYQNSISR